LRDLVAEDAAERLGDPAKPYQPDRHHPARHGARRNPRTKWRTTVASADPTPSTSAPTVIVGQYACPVAISRTSRTSSLGVTSR
jgi:hypothetical protein